MYTLVSFYSDIAMFCVLGEEMVVLSPLLHPHLRDGGHWGSRPPVSINQELFIPSLTGGDRLTGCQGGQLTDGETSWLNSQLISPLLFRLLKFIFCREVSSAVLAWCVCVRHFQFELFESRFSYYLDWKVFFTLETRFSSAGGRILGEKTPGG